MVLPGIVFVSLLGAILGSRQRDRDSGRVKSMLRERLDRALGRSLGGIDALRKELVELMLRIGFTATYAEDAVDMLVDDWFNDYERTKEEPDWRHWDEFSIRGPARPAEPPRTGIHLVDRERPTGQQVHDILYRVFTQRMDMNEKWAEAAAEDLAEGFAHGDERPRWFVDSLYGEISGKLRNRLEELGYPESWIVMAVDDDCWAMTKTTRSAPPWERLRSVHEAVTNVLEDHGSPSEWTGHVADAFRRMVWSGTHRRDAPSTGTRGRGAWESFDPSDRRRTRAKELQDELERALLQLEFERSQARYQAEHTARAWLYRDWLFDPALSRPYSEWARPWEWVR